MISTVIIIIIIIVIIVVIIVIIIVIIIIIIIIVIIPCCEKMLYHASLSFSEFIQTKSVFSQYINDNVFLGFT